MRGCVRFVIGHVASSAFVTHVAKQHLMLVNNRARYKSHQRTGAVSDCA